MCLQDVLILDIVGFSFARQTVLAGVRVESSAKVLQVMHQFVNDQAGDEPGIVVMILRVDVNDVFNLHSCAEQFATDWSSRPET